MSGFAGKLQRFLSDNVPWFLQDPNGGAFLEAVGLTLDLGTQTLLTGMRQSNPLRAFVDNLPYIGADRGIRRYPTEPVQSYRSRLQQWRQIKRHAGSHYGQMLNLRPYFLPGAMPTIYCVHQAGDGSSATWHKTDPDGVYSYTRATPSNFDYDGAIDQWSREFWIIDAAGTRLDPLLGLTYYDDGNVYDGGQVYDGGVEGAGDDMKSLIDEYKAAWTTVWAVIVTTTPFDPAGVSAALPDGSTTLPVGNWGSVIDPVTHLPSRPPYAAWYFDLGQG